MNEIKKKLRLAIFFPLVFIFMMWIVKFTEYIFHLDLAEYGIFPLHKTGLIGILTAPFIHKDFLHLISNSLPLLILGFCIFYFYSEISFKLFFLVYITTNFWVWIFAREAYHIGASGLVYGLAAFIFFSGIIRKNLKLLAISLMVVFLYGGMIWGILPINYHVSWESHLMGAVSGLTFAIFFKKFGPQKEVHQWNDEDDENDEDYYKNSNDPEHIANEENQTELKNNIEEHNAKHSFGFNYQYSEKK